MCISLGLFIFIQFVAVFLSFLGVDVFQQEVFQMIM